MTDLRPLALIQADIAAAAVRLAELEQERGRAREARRTVIVAAFDGGLSRAAIAARWGVEPGTVAQVLHKAGRTARRRVRAGLTQAQQAHYDKLLRHGVASALAGSIARVVAP